LIPGDRHTIKKYLAYLQTITDYSAEKRVAHDYNNVFQRSRSDVSEMLGTPIYQASTLILGCGYCYPEVVFYSTCCRTVVGLDTIGAFYRDGIVKTLKDIHRREGLVPSMLKTMFERYETHGYYQQVEKIIGQPVNHDSYRLVTYDGAHMPFENQMFDVVLSNAVLEHVEDLNGLIGEIARVTKPSGISYHLWHNFYSLSGGHVPQPMQIKYPWGHLRGKYRTPLLNKVTPSEILEGFGRHFESIQLYQTDKNHRKNGVDPDFQLERPDLLTDDLRAQLHYPLELLLTRGYLLTGRRRQAD
jgi:SAM-dependent methyltransferase